MVKVTMNFQGENHSLVDFDLPSGEKLGQTQSVILPLTRFEAWQLQVVLYNQLTLLFETLGHTITHMGGFTFEYNEGHNEVGIWAYDLTLPLDHDLAIIVNELTLPELLLEQTRRNS